MALVRWEPVREITSIQSEMNRLFDTFFDTPTTGNGSAAHRWIPAMDLVETDDHFVLKADLPGLKEEDVSIEARRTSSPSPASARPSTRTSARAMSASSARTARSAAR